MLINILNGLISIFGSIFSGLLQVLPNSPFQFNSTEWPEWVQSAGVILPVAGMVSHMTAFVAAVLVYYGLQWVLRFIKAIE